MEALEIKKIPSNASYWVVRSNGGEYYEEFYNSNTISIGDNNIKLKEIKNLRNENKFKEKIKNLINTNEVTPQQIGIISKRLHRFIHEMEIGDIVLVPNKHSKEYKIGVIISDVLERDEINNSNKNSDSNEEPILTIEENSIIKNSSNNNKFRKVKWLSTVPRSKISSKLLYILTMHQSIIKIENHHYLIDSLISPIYLKNNKIYCNLYVNTNSDINSKEWEKLFEVINQIKDEDEDIAVKANVQSIGLLTLVGGGVLGTLVTLYGILGEIEFKGVKIKGILPTMQSVKHSKLENEGLELENERKHIENEGLKLENERKRIENDELVKIQPVKDKENKYKSLEIDKKIEQIEQKDALQKKINEVKADFNMSNNLKNDESQL